MNNYEILAVLGLAVYLLPALIATIKGRPNKGAIWALNILAGWTAVGWIVAFIWSLTSGRPAGPTVVVNAAPLPSQSLTQATKRCPACAEWILAEAKKCKHCGEVLDGTAAVSAGR